MIQTVKKCCDPKSLPLAAAAVFGGASGAAYSGNFEIFSTIICLLFAMSFLALGSMLYFYSLIRNTWGNGVERYRLSQPGIIANENTEMGLKAAITGMGVVVLILGLGLITMAQPVDNVHFSPSTPHFLVVIFNVFNEIWAWIIGLILVMAIYFGFFGPRPIVRGPWFLLITFICFGPIGVLGTSYIMVTHLPTDVPTLNDMNQSFINAWIVGVFAAISQMMFCYRNCDYSEHHGRHTLVSIIGRKNGKRLMIALAISTWAVSLITTFFIAKDNVWGPGIIDLLGAIVCVVVLVKMNSNWTHDEWIKYMKIVNWTPCITMFLFLIYVLIFGSPNDRVIQFF